MIARNYRLFGPLGQRMGRAGQKMVAAERSLCSAAHLLGHCHQLAEGVAQRMGAICSPEAMRSRPDWMEPSPLRKKTLHRSGSDPDQWGGLAPAGDCAGWLTQPF
jgi:hypothetical protein